MSTIALPVVPTDSRTIEIEGLENVQNAVRRNTEDQSRISTFSTVMHEDELVSELLKRIKDCGFRKPDSLFDACNDIIQYADKQVVIDHDEVVVVGADQTSTKHTIRITESLISHANTYYGKPIDFNINSSTSSQRIIDSNCGFHVSFERTPRMPDDDKLHQLPGSLGSYDLFSVEAYADYLPSRIRKAGGVFLPMWQREAMWLNFPEECDECAVRVFVGHVNAVSGFTMEEMGEREDDERDQDYIVVPDQKWLDGICVSPGIVRQFVAMPLGSGYTVEGQKTSEEKHGGLQLEVTPRLFHRQRLWSRCGDHYICIEGGCFETFYLLNEQETPQQLGCRVGEVLRSYSADPDRRESFKIKHLVGSETTIKLTAFQAPAMYQAPTMYQAPDMMQTLDHFGTAGSAHDRVLSGHSHGSTDPSYEYDSPSHASFPEMGYGGISPDGVSLEGSLCEDTSAMELEEPETMNLKDIKAMGIAAGGKLIQDIYKDPYPAKIWNHAAARILHVHILDPTSCEKITHIVPTPPSTDVKAYTEAGGQYFVVEEKVDERLDGGDFDNVKSVSQMDQHIGISTEPEFDPTKPKMCTTCELRLCDCIIRPCDHQFCNICIKRIEQNSDEDVDSARRNRKCPTCHSAVSHVAGFSAPMNLPGEEPLRVKVPVNVLKIEDGRVRFESVQRSRV